ncbi:MAG: hypothetical protein Q6373_024195 [Candidatus Sigynarchaeota archaeon]
MPRRRDAASRRFSAFARAVRSSIKAESSEWPEMARAAWKSVMIRLLENYLASITSIKKMLAPGTFLAGARLLAGRYMCGSGRAQYFTS